MTQKNRVPRNAYTNFTAACRTAVWPRVKNDGHHLHHAIFSFREIVDDFISENKIDPREIAFIVKGRFVWFIEDEMERQFIDYHTGRAILIKMTKEQHAVLHKKPCCRKWVPLGEVVRLNSVKREYPESAGRHLKKLTKHAIPSIRKIAREKLDAMEDIE